MILQNIFLRNTATTIVSSELYNTSAEKINIDNNYSYTIQCSIIICNALKFMIVVVLSTINALIHLISKKVSIKKGRIKRRDIGV